MCTYLAVVLSTSLQHLVCRISRGGWRWECEIYNYKIWHQTLSWSACTNDRWLFHTVKSVYNRGSKSAIYISAYDRIHHCILVFTECGMQRLQHPMTQVKHSFSSVIILLPELEYGYQHHHMFMPVFFFKGPVCKNFLKGIVRTNSL